MHERQSVKERVLCTKKDERSQGVAKEKVLK